MPGGSTSRLAVAKAKTPSESRKRVVIDLTNDDSDEEEQQPSSARKKTRVSTPARRQEARSPKKPTPERRLTRWRLGPPRAYTDRLYRAMNQRMFVLDRRRYSGEDAASTSGRSAPSSSSASQQRPPTMASGPCEELTFAGTTGNLYTVRIAQKPSCTCPDAAKGYECKHIIYALVRVLKVSNPLAWQSSFLPRELNAIFAAAPLPDPLNAAVAASNAAIPAGDQEPTAAEPGIGDDDDGDDYADDSELPNSSVRKPVAGDCPICFCELASDGNDDGDRPDVVWCRAACGNNIHATCFAQWARSSGRPERCVYCREEWIWEDDDGAKGKGRGGRRQSSPPLPTFNIDPDGIVAWPSGTDGLAALRASTARGEEGYANVADWLGLSGVRDLSTYDRSWLRGHWDEDPDWRDRHQAATQGDRGIDLFACDSNGVPRSWSRRRRRRQQQQWW